MSWTLVTGGARRLGAEICRTLAARGHNLVIHYNASKKEAESVAQECREHGVKVNTIQGDFSFPETTAQFVSSYLDRFSKTKNLVNNVGNYLVRSTLETADADWRSLFQTNLHAPITLIRELLPTLKQQHGNVINIGVAGLEGARADTYSTAYTMTKLSLRHLTKSLAKELAPFHVCVNMVSPGYLDNAVDLPNIGRLPMQRPIMQQEVARVVAFLLEDENSSITGQNIEIAGGVRL